MSVAPSNQTEDLVLALESLTLENAFVLPQADDSTTPGSLGKLFRLVGFRDWYNSIKPIKNDDDSTDSDEEEQSPKKASRSREARWVGRWFHAMLLDHPALLNKAIDRDATGKIFQTFYKQLTTKTPLQPRKAMEPLAMAKLRSFGLLRSYRAGATSVMMMFKDAEGRFPAKKQVVTARDKILQAKKEEEENKEHVVVSDAPSPTFVPMGSEHFFGFEVVVDTANASKIYLEQILLSGPHSSRYHIKRTSELPLDLSIPRKFKVAVTPVSIGVLRAKFDFVFRKLLGSTFTIARYVTFRSGNEEMDKILAPVSPYKRKKTKIRYDISARDVHAAPPLPPSQSGHNPFKSTLKQFKLPDDVADLIIANEFANVVAPMKDSEADYSKFWRYLNWASEFQSLKDIQFYDMDSVSLKRQGRLLTLVVPGLAEGRPSVLRGDLIEVTWKNSIYKGRVQQVRQLEVSLEFAAAFHKKYDPSLDAVDIRFTFSRMTFRTSHSGCNKAPEAMGKAVLFPSAQHLPTASPRSMPYPSNGWMWANRTLNDEQKNAVKNIVEGSLRPLPYIIFGPPGTGKTMTVVETVYHLAKRCGSKVLLVAPSNDAADILVERLAPYFPPSELRRALAYSRPIEAVSKSILPYATEGGPDVKEICSHLTRIVVSTVNLAARFSFLGVNKGCFDVLMIDEAGHATEPEVVAVAATLMDFKRSAQIILAGDPKQLGPVITSEICKSMGMSDSFMARLMARDLYSKIIGVYRSDLVTKLVKNYRSHPSVIKLPNQMFYDNELVCSGDPLATHNLSRWEHLPVKGFPIIFHSIDGDNLREANSPSWFNPQEAQQVVVYVRKLMSETRPPLRSEDIGIITPYARQAQKIRIALESQGMRDIKVGSVETFQGQERRCIIISTVRSLVDEIVSDKRYNLGFVANEKRFNVAITRAKALLIVIGCPRVLALDEANWLPFLRYCHENKAWRGDELEPNSLSIGTISGSGEEENWDFVDAPSHAIEQEGLAFMSREE